MADIVINSYEVIEPHPGQRGYREFYGIGTFNSTDATGTLPVYGNISRVLFADLTAIGTTATDENLSAATTLSSGKMTITRTGASKTSALQFFFCVRGR